MFKQVCKREGTSRSLRQKPVGFCIEVSPGRWCFLLDNKEDYGSFKGARSDDSEIFELWLVKIEGALPIAYTIKGVLKWNVISK